MAYLIPSDNDGNHPVVVAVDKDKHSASAVKWAVDNLLTNNPSLVLIHVRIKNSTNQVGGNEAAIDSNGGLNDEDNHHIFTLFRAYSARRRIAVKEIVLEDTDVSKGILDYISKHRVSNVVLGASSRSALGRKYWTSDVPTIINKAAPEFCTVYIVSKGKQQSVRPATRSLVSSVPSRQPSSSSWTAPSFSNSESEDISSSSSRSQVQALETASGRNARYSFTRAEPKTLESPERTMAEKGLSNAAIDKFQAPHGGRKNPISYSSLSDGNDPFSYANNRSIDFTAENLDFTQVAMKNDFTQVAMKDATRSGSSTYALEDEMRKLKLELKQTLNMYNAACKEAVMANQAAEELHKWKKDEARRFEQARLSEEAARAIAETEKAKCRAAVEAAKKAQKMAEIEVQRRRYAELKAKQEVVEKNRALDVLSQNDVRYRKYTIEEIEAATNNFSNSQKVGEGGYGPVFKGKLDHTPVAIKVLSADAAQGKKQFQQEVEVLSLMRHPNLVLLLGACPEYGCLVYEFMNNGSLEDRLFRKGNTPSIPWEIRFKIAAEIATALLFLHQAKPEPLVHRDLKPANILLDSNYVCKISDVGLARLVPSTVADCVTQYHMTSAAGTFCYIDPEYQQTGKLGTKSDIYSLGIMLLQIITARPPMGLTHHVERAIEKGTFADLLDPTVPNWPMEEALKFAKLSLKCAELRKKDRPDLGSEIVPELNKLKEIGLNSMPMYR